VAGGRKDYKDRLVARIRPATFMVQHGPCALRPPTPACLIVRRKRHAPSHPPPNAKSADLFNECFAADRCNADAFLGAGQRYLMSRGVRTATPERPPSHPLARTPAGEGFRGRCLSGRARTVRARAACTARLREQRALQRSTALRAGSGSGLRDHPRTTARCRPLAMAAADRGDAADTRDSAWGKRVAGRYWVHIQYTSRIDG
jgi:hypothetical protein